MTGYQLNRFVNLTRAQKKNLICSLCACILRDPVVVSCCAKSYCKECITGWIQQNKTCPHDRKELKDNQLQIASKYEYI